MPILLIGVILFMAPIASATESGERFVYQFLSGDRYHIVSTVYQDVLVNGIYSHSATILNRIAVSVERERDGSGYLRGRFLLSEEARTVGETFRISREYQSDYWQGPDGKYDIAPHHFLPVVRDVPLFPDRELVPGDAWEAIGKEAHDFRDSFGIPEPYHFEMPVQYRYLGERSYRNRDYPAFSIRYTIAHRNRSNWGVVLYPQQITGYSDQILYWDHDAGRPRAYREEYQIIVRVNNGSELRFEGSAEAEVIEPEPLDRERVGRDLRERLDDAEVADTEVVPDELGITIRLENIQFPPNSAQLLPPELEKLRRIADILRRYPKRDILVTGHTALAGTAAQRQELSEERAAAVAQVLLASGDRNRSQVLARGMGGRQPIATNSTEAGKHRNRRVEITILEN